MFYIYDYEFGWYESDRIRIRPTTFGVVLEQLWVHDDGRADWRKCDKPIELADVSEFTSG